MNEWPGASPQTARAAERQPTNFDGLKTEVVDVDDLVVTRSIACQCGNPTGRVIAGEPLPDWGWLDPLTWVCDGCEKSHNFFDSARDGYDGRLGHGTTHRQAENQVEIDCPECGGQSLQVQCPLAYNVAASELDDILGPNKSHRLTDYFDWLEAKAECVSCRRRFTIGDWELA